MCCGPPQSVDIFPVYKCCAQSRQSRWSRTWHPLGRGRWRIAPGKDIQRKSQVNRKDAGHMEGGNLCFFHTLLNTYSAKHNMEEHEAHLQTLRLRVEIIELKGLQCTSATPKGFYSWHMDSWLNYGSRVTTGSLLQCSVSLLTEGLIKVPEWRHLVYFL